MDKIYKSEVLIYTEDLPTNIAEEVQNYLKKESGNTSFTITEEKTNDTDKEKFPDATTKFSVIGDCVNWTDDFRNIIKLLRLHTICVLII